jgi:hypothetical protein
MLFWISFYGSISLPLQVKNHFYLYGLSYRPTFNADDVCDLIGTNSGLFYVGFKPLSKDSFMSSIQLFALVMFCIITGFVIGFISCSFSFSSLVKKQRELIEIHIKESASIQRKTIYQQEIIDTLTELAVQQADKIEEISKQVIKAGLIRLEEQTKKLNDHLELNKDFLNGLSKN